MLDRVQLCAMALIAIALSGCAGQQVMKDQQAQIELQAMELAKHQAMLDFQYSGIDQLQQQQESINDLLEVNQMQMAELIDAVRTKNAGKKGASAPKSANTSERVKEISNDVPSPQKMVLGRVEWVWVDKLDGYLKARVDTGAKSSSIHASDVQYFERDGKQWVRFNLYTHKKTLTKVDEERGPKPFEAPVLRTVKIKQASAEAMDKRPVVKLRVRIGKHEDDAEFTLNDRTNMLYPILLGRSFMQDVAVVDVGQVFIHKRLPEDKE